MNAWAKISSSKELRQGDVLESCQIPFFDETYGTEASAYNLPIAPASVIVLTQSCDLVVRDGKPAKAVSVALCRIYQLAEFSEASPGFRNASKREEARKGRIEGIQLIPSQVDQTDNQTVLIANFREIFSLPFHYLERHAESFVERKRLNSPYLEHFAQGFARFFMRVGLPLDIPQFT